MYFTWNIGVHVFVNVRDHYQKGSSKKVKAVGCLIWLTFCLSKSLTFSVFSDITSTETSICTVF